MSQQQQKPVDSLHNKPSSGVVRFPARAYYVSCPTDPTVRLALDVVYDHATNQMNWFNTLRRKSFTVKEFVIRSRNHFVFERAAAEGGGMYTLVPLTLEIYNQMIKPTMHQPQEFGSKQELVDFCQQGLEGNRYSG